MITSPTFVYRCRRYLWLGIVGTIFFVAMGIWSFTEAWFDADGSFAQSIFPSPHFAAFGFGLAWLGPMMMGVWLIIYAARARLSLSSTELRMRGCFQVQELLWSEVTAVKWWTAPAKYYVRLKTEKIRLNLDLNTFAPPDRLAIIRFVRKKTDRAPQENWKEFRNSLLLHRRVRIKAKADKYSMPKLFTLAGAVLLMAEAAAISTALAYQDSSPWLRGFYSDMKPHIYTVAFLGIAHLAGGVVLAIGIRFFKWQPS